MMVKYVMMYDDDGWRCMML